MSCPTPIRMICLVISVLTALTALAGIVIGVVDRDPFLTAFEVVVLLASIFGVLAGAGKLRGLEAATMLCAGGTVFVAAVLSEPSVITGLALVEFVPVNFRRVSESCFLHPPAFPI